MISGARFDEIEEIAAYLLIDYDCVSFPLDIFGLLAKFNNIKVIPYSQIEKQDRDIASKVSDDGFTICDGVHDKYIICYNDDCKNQNRIRLTLAHEFGHIALDHYLDMPDIDDADKEQEANHFAAYILAPSIVILYFFELNIESICTCFELSCECALFTFDRARKRFNCGPKISDYEIELVKEFHKNFPARAFDERIHRRFKR